MSLKIPAGRARGLISAKTGVGHWWWQRITAVALIPLSLWFVVSIITMIRRGLRRRRHLDPISIVAAFHPVRRDPVYARPPRRTGGH